MKEVLISQDIHPLFLSSLQFLNRADIAVGPLATNDDILKRHFERHADLIIAKINSPGVACETMVHIIRRSESLRAVSILICYDDLPVLKERSAACGANGTIALPANPSQLAAKVLELLDVRPRRNYRVVMNMTVDGLHRGKPFLCNTENISSSGMLIRTPEPLTIGSRISCSLYLPDGTKVAALGAVVRVVRQTGASTTNQYGIRFLTIAPSAEAAITAFVQKECKTAPSVDDRRGSLVA